MPKPFPSPTAGPISDVEQIKALKGQALVTLHNELSQKEVKKFADAKVGLKRTIAAFETWQEQQKGTPKAEKAEEQTTFRPDSKRGTVIKMCNKAGGSTFADLKKETGWDDSELKSALARIETYNGLTVKTEGEGDATVVIITGSLRTRKAFSFDPKKEVKEVKAGSKRAKVLELLKGGATYAQIQEATGWDTRTAYEGIRLIHTYLGYGLREGSDGRIFAVSPSKAA